MTEPEQEIHRPYRWEDPEDTEHLFDARYPRLQAPRVEPGAGWREKRRASKTARAARRNAAHDLDRKLWQGLPTDAGLGVGLAILAAVLVGVFFLWPRGDDPQPPGDAAAPPATSNPTTGSAGISQQATPTPAGDDIDGPAGRIATQFLLAANTYSPADPHPVDTWIGGFEHLADKDLVATARDQADKTWGWADKQKVSVLAEDVSDCEPVEQPTGGQHVWLCDVHRAVWPADESKPATAQTVHARVEVADHTDGPLVTAAVQLSTTDSGEIPAPTAPEGVGE